jgi:bifunctional non-homologous end joining protein LigD
MVKEETTLYFREGTSDKVYSCSIEESGSGFIVPFAYGRRGGTMNTGNKTAGPVSYAEAKKIFDKLVHEKTAKGYSVGASGTPYTAPAVSVGAPKVTTGLNVQLLNPVDEHEAARLVLSNQHVAQQKFDGKRMLLRRVGEKFTAINRKGLECGCPTAFKEALEPVKGDFIIDGEAIGDVFFAFDCLQSKGVNVREEGYLERYADLQEMIEPLGSDTIQVAPVAVSPKEKQALLDDLKAAGMEGIVFKDAKAHYSPGRPASGGSQFKFKFVHTCSAVVTRVNGSKRSVALELDDDGTPVPVGNCTVPPDKKIPEPGDIVEVRYLYAYRGGSLYQPFLIGVRDDIGIEGCSVKQLHYKEEGKGGGEEVE